MLNSSVIIKVEHKNFFISHTSKIFHFLLALLYYGKIGLGIDEL